jgi:type I restriction enzyme M protein
MHLQAANKLLQQGLFTALMLTIPFIAPLANANKLSDVPDFNEVSKLGSGKEMVERLTNLIAIFENKALDFSKNRAEGDDILGDAYEYLMRHFATEGGKSKGQFYTPAE